MKALLVLFELRASFGTLAELRAYIAEKSAPKYKQVEGLRMKIFLSDEEGNRTGALYLWESEQALEAYVPQIGASSFQQRGVIPELHRFNVEAIVEGRHHTPDLAQAGSATEMSRV
jgi:hypothetical protein